MVKLLVSDLGTNHRVAHNPHLTEHWSKAHERNIFSDRSTPPVTKRCHSLDPNELPPAVYIGRKDPPPGDPIVDHTIPDLLIERQQHYIVVSDRLKELIEKHSGESVQTFPVDLRNMGEKRKYVGQWWMLNFLQTHDTIDEKISNREPLEHAKIEGFQNSILDEVELFLNSRESAPNGMWVGEGVFPNHWRNRLSPASSNVHFRDPPCNLNSHNDIYCSDALYADAHALGMDICDHNFDVKEPSVTKRFALHSPYWWSKAAAKTVGSAKMIVPIYAGVRESYNSALSSKSIAKAKAELDATPPGHVSDRLYEDFSIELGTMGPEAQPLPPIFQSNLDFLLSATAFEVIENFEPGVHSFVRLQGKLAFGEEIYDTEDLFLLKLGHAANAHIFNASSGLGYWGDFGVPSGDIVCDGNAVADSKLWGPSEQYERTFGRIVFLKPEVHEVLASLSNWHAKRELNVILIDQP